MKLTIPTILFAVVTALGSISFYFFQQTLSDIKEDVAESRADIKRLLIASGINETETKSLDKRVQLLENKSVSNRPINTPNPQNEEPLFVKLIFKHEEDVLQSDKKRS